MELLTSSHLSAGFFCAFSPRSTKSVEDGFSALKVAFPAGTVSGAPKIRAMEIIDELENNARGIYAGAIGYFSFTGNLDTCITIRTLLINGDQSVTKNTSA